MDSTDIKNKLVLDPETHPDFAEAVSKLEPGDKVTLEVEATLEEGGDKVIVLAVTDAEITPDETPEEEASEDETPEEDAAESEAEPAAVKLFKGKKQEAEA